MQYPYTYERNWGSFQQSSTPLVPPGYSFQTEVQQEDPVNTSNSFQANYHDNYDSATEYTSIPPLLSYTPLNFDVAYVSSNSSNGLQTPATPSRTFAFPLSVSPQQLHIPREIQPLEVVLAVEEESYHPSPIIQHTKASDHSTYVQPGPESDSDSDSDSDAQSECYYQENLKMQNQSVREQTVSQGQGNPSTPIRLPVRIETVQNGIEASPSEPIIPTQDAQVSLGPLAASAVIQSPAIAKPPLLKKSRKPNAAKVQKAVSGRQILLSKRKKPAAKVKPSSQSTPKKSKLDRGRKLAVPPPTLFPVVPMKDRSDKGISPTNGQTTEISYQKPKNVSRPRAPPKTKKLATTPELSAEIKSATKIKLRKKGSSQPNSTTLSQGSNRRKMAIAKYDESPPLSPASEAVSIPNDRDYQPSPSPLLEELEVSSDSELPISALKIKKRARARNEDDEEWGMHDKKKKHNKVGQNANGEDETVRILNKARGKLYHPGRSEQNMRAQSKYRNKVKNRSDLAFDALQELFALEGLKPKQMKEKMNTVKHDFAQRLQALDPSFAREKFPHLL